MSVTVEELIEELANTTDASKGDAMVGVRRVAAGPNDTGSGRTQDDKNRDLLTPEDFGTADNATTIKAAIAEAVASGTNGIRLTPGKTYAINETIAISSNFWLYGNGATLLLDSNFPITSSLMVNSDPGMNEDIHILDVNFDGFGLNIGSPYGRDDAMVLFADVEGIFVTGCCFRNFGWTGLSINECENVLVDRCEFHHLGMTDPEATSRGSSLWIASYAASAVSKNVVVSNNHFHHNEWHVHISCENGTVVGNVLTDNKEAGFYLPWDTRETPFYVADRIAISGNVIDGVAVADTSGSGIECHLRNSVISGNVFRNCSHAGISILRGRNVVIKGNVIIDAGVNPETGDITSGIAITSGKETTATWLDANSSNILVAGNRIYCTSTSLPVTKYGIIAAGISGTGITSGAARYCRIYGNDLSNSTWLSGGKAYHLPATILGTPPNHVPVGWDYDTSIAVVGFAPHAGSGTLPSAGIAGDLFTADLRQIV